MGATETAARVVVCDAGPLIHLDQLGCLGLLSDFREVLVPTAFGPKSHCIAQRH